ncbi:unknown [Firmicutes bacterium CAG:460]|nr:unknown [Firmicutes bacterium CAG:460]
MFIKFKKYMKNVKSNMISDLQGYKNIVNMLELWPLDFQKYVEMLKDTKSNELTNILKEALGDLTKYDIKSAKERLKKHIGMLNTQIYICDSQIRAFDNEKAIGAIEDFPLFYVTLISIIGKNYLTNKEAIKIFGSAISFKGKKTGENKTPEDLWKCDFESLRPLSNYFDIYGNFQNGGDAELFMILFNQLSKATRLKELGINNDELKLIKYTSLSNKLMIELRSSYEEYLKTAIKREVKPEMKKEKKSEVRKEALDPIIVETEKLSFLTDEDKEIYLMACNLISSLVGRSDYDYYMEALLDIQSLEELYNDEDKEYFDEIINDAINKLKILLNMFHIDKKIRKPEVVFLNDIKGNCYFKEDLDNVDNSLKSKIDLLLEKVKSGNNHRTVLDGNLKAGELLFINGSNLSISFCKIAFDTYLIIGVHSINEGFNLDINRYHLNKKYIEELKELMKNAEDRNKMVLDGNLVIETSVPRKKVK